MKPGRVILTPAGILFLAIGCGLLVDAGLSETVANNILRSDFEMDQAELTPGEVVDLQRLEDEVRQEIIDSRAPEYGGFLSR